MVVCIHNGLRAEALIECTLLFAFFSFFFGGGGCSRETNFVSPGFCDRM